MMDMMFLHAKSSILQFYRSVSNAVVPAPFHRTYSFEHSLVKELGYSGYERLRRGFDRAFGGSESVPKFSLVIDAGCGTGLVGEQVRVAR